MDEVATTRNEFPKDTKREDLEREVESRRKDSSVVKCWLEEETDKWVIVTERRVL